MTRQLHTERRGQSLYQEDDGTPGKAKYIAEFKSADDADRALACVNACTGIPTEALEAGIIELYVPMLDADEVRKIRAELVIAEAKLRGET